MMTSRKLRLAILLLALASMVGCDQATKHVARVQLGGGESVVFPGGLGELRLAENAGAFLSLGASLPASVRVGIFTVGVGAGLLVLFGYLVVRPQQSWLPFAGLALVLTGGVGNLIDRITREGFVTDFIVLRAGPLQTGVFNVADMAVTFGIVLLIWAQWKQPRPTPAPPSEPA